MLASAIAVVAVGVLVAQYFVASQLARADAINSTDFVMTIDTRKGTGNTFTVPTIGGGYNYTLVCGNGVVLTGQTGNATCSYATADVCIRFALLEHFLGYILTTGATGLRLYRLTSGARMSGKTWSTRLMGRRTSM